MTSGKAARAAAAGLLAVLGLLTAGCVNLPADSGVNAVSKQTEAGSGSDVRIWPQAPRRDQDQASIVEGFLQTAASDPSNLAIARAYLTSDARNWDPSKVVVFGSDETSPTSLPKQPDTVQISGTVVATVGDDGTYQPLADAQHKTYYFHVKRDDAKGYYQIDQLPSGDFGIAMTQETFRANYTEYNLYYLNADAPDASMVPVPVYVRSQPDSSVAENLAEKLVKGPAQWLDAAAGPVSQIDLAGPGNAVSITADGTAEVAVKTPNACTGHAHGVCERLAAEFLATFSNLASVNRVAIVDAHGSELGVADSVENVMRQYHLGPVGSVPGTYYYLGAKDHRVYYDDGKNTRPEQVGPADRRYSQLAVTDYDGRQSVAAVVDDHGADLYLGEPGNPATRAPTWTGAISSLSWDALGHLWFIDQAGGTPVLYRLDITQGLEARPQRVDLIGADAGPITIKQLAVAPDGRRVAVVYSETVAGSGTVYSVGLGVYENSVAGQLLDLAEAVNNPMVYQWHAVSDIDWHSSQTFQSLAVLGGSQASSPSVISELYADGSPVTSANDLTAVTVNPPNGTSGIEWTGGTLLATYRTAQGDDQISQYAFTSGSWNPQGTTAVDGLSPSYTD
ncbi:hypothetical protein KGA66_03845 [Actinocrinis puniceicyclus]|uniref:Lipoprotein LpqB beta-propeller domain-containing protein n=1 Tax=Actinocrinis puniceicyclus TaxID=977794 RepID=A0A8J7WMI5_9ACTN|nr:LpqB family beta-propeller domain-containing protein [Actinocrinis puniceicyclus]MBS2962164.1 hypothetical protein [Actinocrinis puniceicyclus]